jgi:nucleoid-associated protein YgaU
MAVNEKKEEEQALGPSVVLGLVGAVVVLLLLGAGIWGVGKIISKIRESKEEEEKEEEEVAEITEETETPETTEEAETEETTEGEVNGDAVTDEQEQGESQETTEETEETTEEETAVQEENIGGLSNVVWVANNYVKGDVNGDTYTVVWGDTLWEISEGRYGSGFEWGKIKEANLDKIGYLPNGSQALIFPGQVLKLP